MNVIFTDSLTSIRSLIEVKHSLGGNILKLVLGTLFLAIIIFLLKEKFTW